jgi:two-component system, OmpR family, sensor kinase
MMFASLRTRLWLSYVLVISLVILVAALALAVYLIRNPASDRRELQRIRLISMVLVQRSQALSLPLWGVSEKQLEDAAKRADTLFDLRVALFDPQGTLLADSRAERERALPKWAVLIRPRLLDLPMYRDPSGRQWLFFLTPVQGGGFLLVSAPRQRTSVLVILRDEFLTPFLRILGISLLLSILMAFWVAQWISAPLKNLSDAASSASLGTYKKIEPKGPREVQGLTNSLNEMIERVQTSQRAQRDLIANVSHDLKTPLTSIQGFAQAILDGAASDPVALNQSARIIYDEAGRMNRMVLDLLDLARIDAGTFSFERTLLDLDHLLSGVVQEFSPQANQAGVQLHYTNRNAEVPLMILGDSDRLSQVFSNLVDNALKFSPQGSQVSVLARSQDGWVEAVVEDSGPGIPPGETERIFERFYQTDKSRAGSGQRNGARRGVGLGLAIAREIVQAHGGTIQAYNHPAAVERVEALQPPATGSVFVVRLPAARLDDETLLRKRSMR